MNPATTKAKTVKVKAVGVFEDWRSDGELLYVFSYDKHGMHSDRRMAETHARNYKSATGKLVDCVITFTPPKGRKKP